MSVLTETTLTLTEAARRLGKTYATVKRWIDRPGANGLPLEAKKIGGTCYTSLEALDRYSESSSRSRNPQAMRDLEAERVLSRFGIGR